MDGGVQETIKAYSSRCAWKMVHEIMEGIMLDEPIYFVPFETEQARWENSVEDGGEKGFQPCEVCQTGAQDARKALKKY